MRAVLLPVALLAGCASAPSDGATAGPETGKALMAAIAANPVSCDQWRGKYMGNGGGDLSWDEFAPTGPVMLRIAEDEFAVDAPLTFPAGRFPASAKDGPNAAFYDGDSVTMRRISASFIETFTFFDLGASHPRLKWDRIRIADGKAGEIFLDVGCHK